MRAPFVTWMSHCRRSDGLAAALGAQSHLVSHLGFQRPATAPLRYLMDALATVRILARSRPEAVLVASPPFVAPLVVWAYAALRRIPFVIDAHTGVFDDPRWRWSLPVSRFLSRRAAATVVTSEHLRRQVEAWGARAVVVGDVPMPMPPVAPAELGPGFHVAVVCSFGKDEPVAAVLEAARGLDGIRLHVTGRASRADPALVASAPPNVRFTGFMPDDGFVALMRAADAVLVLTTRDHTMQRGAYEAVALAKPLITSDWPILRETFSRGTIHVDNSPGAIRAALIEMRDRHPEMRTEAEALRAHRLQVLEGRVADLRQALAAA